MTAECGEALSFFLSDEEDVQAELLGGGLVNDTWCLTLREEKRYILQRLNPRVFPDPIAIQDNLSKVTRHIHAQLPTESQLRGRPFRFFHPVANQNGVLTYQDKSRVYWRLLTHINDSQSLHSISTAHQAEEIGATLGLFHQLLSSLPPDSLTDPLPDFHNTPLYLTQYDNLLTTSQQPKARDCQNFIDQHREEAFLLENARKQKKIGQQIIHADPKVANFLFSRDGQQVISLIDLDTVRPGLLLHDIGDCLRSCCNPLGEEVERPEDIHFHRNLFETAIHGYQSIAGDLLTPEDRRLLVDSVWLISFELGLRFYSDYLANNCYFKIAYPEHNLFRARVQFALARSIEQQYDRLSKFIY